LGKAVARKRLKRIINSYILAQDDPFDKRKLKLLQRYLYSKNIGKIKIGVLKNYISKRMKIKKKKEKMNKMEALLFKKDKKLKKIKYGSAFCSNCNMFKDYNKECPYCNKLELTR